jgi:pimeloyl-ACP methyl ester carboxylesterase
MSTKSSHSVNTMKTSLSAIVAALSIVAPWTAAHAADAAATPAKTVVLVHGAFADGSSWNRVIPLLKARGLNVVAVQNPLSSLADDVAATRRALKNVEGPVVLVGHSWGGAVITEAGLDEKVKSLVYVAAFAPSEGQSVAALGQGYPTPPGIATLVSDAEGYVSMTPPELARNFAQDVPAAEAALMAATQAPIRGSAFEEKVSTAAWKTKPSWFIVTTRDRMIAPELQYDMAKRIGAHTVSLPTSHVPMASDPRDVAAAIVEASK